MATKNRAQIAPRNTHTLDATGQVMGRLASRVAILLQGKHKPEYVPNWDRGDAVVIKNAAKMVVTGKKMSQKLYHSYSGYPGGLKTKILADVWKKNPGDALEHAVFNMLAKNRLRKERMKRLKITP